MAAPMKDLNEITKHDKPVQAFLLSMDMVFKYNSKEVQSCLNQLDIESLHLLHGELCSKFIVCFPVYAGRRTTHRQLKKTIVPDIYHLGYSIVCGTPTREAEKIFGKELCQLASDDEDLTPDKTLEIEHLLKILTDLTSRVQGLEKEVKIIKQENAELKELLHTDNHSVTSLSSQQTFVSVPSHDPLSNDLLLTQPDPATVDESSSQTYAKVALDTHHTLSCCTTSDESFEESDAGSPFVPPNHYLKKIRKLENKVKKLSADSNKKPETVKTASTANKQKAPNHVKPLRASESTGITGLKSVTSDNHDSDIYIGGVSSDNSGEDVTGFLKTKGINHVGQISRLSHNSFKFAVPSADFNTVVKEIKWPNGIHVRAFRKKKPNSRQPQKRRQYRQPNNSNYKEPTEFYRGHQYRAENRDSDNFHYGYRNPDYDRETTDYYPNSYRGGWSNQWFGRDYDW